MLHRFNVQILDLLLDMQTKIPKTFKQSVSFQFLNILNENSKFNIFKIRKQNNASTEIVIVHYSVTNCPFGISTTKNVWKRFSHHLCHINHFTDKEKYKALERDDKTHFFVVLEILLSQSNLRFKKKTTLPSVGMSFNNPKMTI